MTAPLGTKVAPWKWSKLCPECARPYVGGRRSRYCDPCRRKLKAWRKKTRREIARAKLGLFPGDRVAKLRLGRKKPTKRTARRYRKHVCLDCGDEFVAGARGLRCEPCNDRWRRKRQAAYSLARIARGDRKGRRGTLS